MSEIGYTLQEIRSYLPTGWTLAPGAGSGGFDARTSKYTLGVCDGAEVTWDLVVTAKDVSAQGRIPALRLAFDKLFRERLG